ncbi:MAG: hypothetical protein ACYCX4_11330 [Bacillota bacterium]
MQVLVCIDDTDNLESKGTGYLAARIAQAIEDEGWGRSDRITRHQLFVHADIPYTSHNSAMCFGADVDADSLDRLINHASEILQRESATGSDPGLCVAVPALIYQPELLIDFGKNAKQTVLTKQKAYDLAKRLGIHLSEHGGTGQGVIGALAGVGLRLSGNDGRFRGKLQIAGENEVVTVWEILNHPYVDEVRSMAGDLIINGDDLVRLGEKVKTVLLEGKSVLLVCPAADENVSEICWQTCTKEQLKIY